MTRTARLLPELALWSKVRMQRKGNYRLFDVKSL